MYKSQERDYGPLAYSFSQFKRLCGNYVIVKQLRHHFAAIYVSRCAAVVRFREIKSLIIN